MGYDIPQKVYFVYTEFNDKRYWYANKGGGAWGLSPYFVDAMPLTARHVGKVQQKLNRVGGIKYKDVHIPLYHTKVMMYRAVI